MTDFWYIFWITVIDFFYISCVAGMITTAIYFYNEEEKLKS